MTIRPAQSTTTIPSFNLWAVSFSCMAGLFSETRRVAPNRRACKGFVAKWRRAKCASQCRFCAFEITYNHLSPSMSYQVLARKYRPQKFSEVIGQEHVTRTLKNAIEQERIAHGYIFSGHRGIGKTTIARILAMELNCGGVDGKAYRPTAHPRAVSESLDELRAGGAVDVIEIDAATNRGIDEI